MCDLVLLCPERLSNILLIKPSDCLLHLVLRVIGKFSQTEMTFLLMNGSRWIYSISVNAVFLWIGKSYLKQLLQFLLNKEDDLGGTYERHNFSRLGRVPDFIRLVSGKPMKWTK